MKRSASMEDSKLFLFDIASGTRKTWQDLIEDLQSLDRLPVHCYEKEIYRVFLYVIASLLTDSTITVLDSDFSREELAHLGIAKSELKQTVPVRINNISGPEGLIARVGRAQNWRLSLFTSGTTGVPKMITHNFENMTRSVRINSSKENDVWGFAYNPTHIAGLQVFFQALLNQNSLVNIFLQDKEQIFDLIEQEGITNISATPTYYRLLLPTSRTFPDVKRITLGGEKFDPRLADRLNQIFPNAKILNVYASTEAGTVLAAQGDSFTVKPKDRHKIKIVENELWVHKSLLGENELLTSDNEWYHTGDMVEIQEKDPLTFRFVSRKNETINVGGYNVNPLEVEEIINSHPKVKTSTVYAKESSLVGNLLMCDVEAVDDSLTEMEITRFLNGKVQPFKIPRIINVVSKIEVTRTGKIKRW